MKHAKRSGWRPFWAALCAALLVLLPLVGGTVLLSRAQLRSSLRQAAKSQSGVPIRLPKAADRCTVLLCVADETPGFVLAYLNAGQNCIHLLAVPAALEVPFGGKNVPLADCYAAAGPARCREAGLPRNMPWSSTPGARCASWSSRRCSTRATSCAASPST